jgi:hypothetical protein
MFQDWEVMLCTGLPRWQVDVMVNHEISVNHSRKSQKDQGMRLNLELQPHYTYSSVHHTPAKATNQAHARVT